MPVLEPEQVYGRNWLAPRPRALLGDIMGYGKTAQAVTAAIQAGAQRVAVACPAVARLNWEREARKWGWELPIVRVTEKDEHRLPATRGPVMAIASYDGIVASKTLRGALNSGVWDVLICDEAHRLKNPASNRTRAIYGRHINAQRCLSGKALRTWLLSASIMPNDAGELWTHLHALWPELLWDPLNRRHLDYDSFLARYCIVEHREYGPRILGYRDREGLVAILQQIMLRRDKISGLPPLVMREDPYLLEVDDRRLAELEAHEEFEDLRRVLDSALAREQDLAGIEDEYIHLATLRRLTGLLKARPASDVIMGEMGRDDKGLVFAMHREVLEQLENYFTLGGFNPVVVHGGVPDGQRNRVIDRFNEDPSCQIFVGQVQACQEVLNLPAANRVWAVESPWSPEALAQAIARAHRRGQQRTVFASTMAIAGSIDELVQRVIAIKTRNIQALMRERYTTECTQ